MKRTPAKYLALGGLAYLVQLAYVVVGRTTVDHLIAAISKYVPYLATHEHRQLLWAHPFLFAIPYGLALGLLPLNTLADALGLFHSRLAEWQFSWQSTKAWICIPFGLALLPLMSTYVAHKPFEATSVWRAFFLDPCALDRAHVLTYRYGCANQIIWTAPFITSVAYSLTVLLQKRRSTIDSMLIDKTSTEASAAE